MVDYLILDFAILEYVSLKAKGNIPTYDYFGVSRINWTALIESIYFKEKKNLVFLTDQAKPKLKLEFFRVHI